MKINCCWRADYDAVFVSALLTSPSVGIVDEEIDLLIDTGAIRTTILDRDVNRLGIDFNKLPSHRYKMTGIGGEVETYTIKDAVFMFSTDKDNSQKECIELMVLRHDKMNERIEWLPSLLGRAILGKYHLIYSKPYQKIYFTDENLD